MSGAALSTPLCIGLQSANYLTIALGTAMVISNKHGCEYLKQLFIVCSAALFSYFLPDRQHGYMLLNSIQI